MTVNRTTLLDLPLPVTGTESGTWGDTTNNGLTQYLDIAIAGTLVLSTDADVTLTSTEGDSSATNIGATTAQYAILRWTATGSTTRNITALAQSKTYVVINATGGTQSIVLRGAGPTTGVTIISGEKAHCVWNGSDFVKVSSSAAAGGSNTQVQYNSSGVLAGSSNLTFDGTSLTLGGNPTLSAGTANGVLYLNGSKVATSGSALTFDGNTFKAVRASSGSVANFTRTGGQTAVVYADTTGIAFGLDDGAGAIGSNYVYFNNSSNYAIFQINGSEQMRLTSTGLKSSIAGTNADPVFSYTSDTNTGIFFPAADKLGFTAGGGTDDMVLTTAGLGIGTSSPGAKLDVNGEVRALYSSGFTLYNAGSQISKLYYNGGLILDRAAGTNLYFTLNGSNQAILDSSGNLGLGVTPSAWGGGYKAMTINQGRSIAGTNSGAGDFSLVFNAFYDATDNRWEYEYTGDPATRYSTNSGVHAWFTAPSGTAGNAISFTQAMTLDASGNLAVGNTASGSFASETGTKLSVGTGSGETGLTLYTGSSSYGQILWADGTSGAATYAGILRYDHGINAMQFYTNGLNERARITSGGYFKASNTGTYEGSTSAYHELRTNANAPAVIISNAITSGFTDSVVNIYLGYAANTTTSYFIQGYDTSATRFYVRTNGGIGNYSANDVNLSDRREKTNFSPASSYLDKICAIPVQTFNYIDQSEDDPGLTLGVVAQDVQAVAPELVMESNWGTEENPKMRLSIYQTDLQYALMKCIQEQQALITSLTARVALLEGN